MLGHVGAVYCPPARPSSVLHHYGPRTHRDLAAFATTVSLHAHTWYSREPLTFIPGFASRIPVVRQCAKRELARYRRRAGKVIDFSRAFWRPPLVPCLVFRSEVEQISSMLGLDPLVSLTDHDSIKAGQMLRSTSVDLCAPISLEWTVPFGETEFHLGVHNLPPVRANRILRELIAFTACRRAASLPALLEWIGGFPGVLVVLNHPFWDLRDLGADRHRTNLLAFLRTHGSQIHALEVNGYRRSSENHGVLRLAQECGLPVVSGGDRHGRVPNALLNLTRAGSFDDFAAEIRNDKRSEILVMPAYRDSLRFRKLVTAADVLRDDPQHAQGCTRWTERIYYQDGGPIRPLCDHWPGGAPPWLDLLVRGVARLPFASAAHLMRLPHAPMITPAPLHQTWPDPDSRGTR